MWPKVSRGAHGEEWSARLRYGLELESQPDVAFICDWVADRAAPITSVWGAWIYGYSTGYSSLIIPVLLFPGNATALILNFLSSSGKWSKGSSIDAVCNGSRTEGSSSGFFAGLCSKGVYGLFLVFHHYLNPTLHHNSIRIKNLPIQRAFVILISKRPPISKKKKIKYNPTPCPQ